MSEPKRHHLVPQFYLKRFGLNDRVDLLDPNDLRKSRSVTIENAIVQRHFYSPG